MRRGGRDDSLSVAFGAYSAGSRASRWLVARRPKWTERWVVAIADRVPQIVVRRTRLRFWAPECRALVFALSVACVCITVVDSILLGLALSSY